eukprot:Nk52_evm20s2496 gene=Nk52_evmTU20s2496
MRTAKGPMKNIPYPEYKDFRIQMKDDVIVGDEPVEGFVKVELDDRLPNCLVDVVVELSAVVSIVDVGNKSEAVKLLEKTQRGASTFDSGGLPGGVYEFPFMFQIPEELPASVLIVANALSSFVYKVLVTYQIRAYILHAENHILDRKCLRMTHKFHRFLETKPDLTIDMPWVSKKQDFLFHSGKYVDVSAKCLQNIFNRNDPLKLRIKVKNGSGKTISNITTQVRQIVTTQEKKKNGELGKEIKEVYELEKDNFTAGCPIRPDAVYETILKCTTDFHQHYGPALHSGEGFKAGAEKPIAPSTRLDMDCGIITVDYDCVVKFHVHLGNAIVIHLPFKLGDSYQRTDGDELPQIVTGLEPEIADAKGISSEAIPIYDSAAPSKVNEENVARLPGYDEVIRSPDVYSDISNEQCNNTASSNTPYITSSGMIEDMIENPGATFREAHEGMAYFNGSLSEIDQSELPDIRDFVHPAELAGASRSSSTDSGCSGGSQNSLTVPGADQVIPRRVSSPGARGSRGSLNSGEFPLTKNMQRLSVDLAHEINHRQKRGYTSPAGSNFSLSSLEENKDNDDEEETKNKRPLSLSTLKVP